MAVEDEEKSLGGQLKITCKSDGEIGLAQGMIYIGANYRNIHSLSGSCNIAGHFLEMSGMEKLAEKAGKLILADSVMVPFLRWIQIV